MSAPVAPSIIAPVRRSENTGKIWIDLDNTPHVPFFAPIIRELERRGFQTVVTARDAFSTCELAEYHDFKFRRVGRHYGKNRLFKLFGLIARSAQLLPFVLGERPDLALSHGSRSQILLANALGVPSIEISDYEHVTVLPLLIPEWLITPEVMKPGRQLPARKGTWTYRGIKEDVYLPDFVPDPSILGILGINSSDTLITLRPPATEAHYHNVEAEELFNRFVKRVSESEHTKVVILPRNRRQADEIKAAWGRQLGGGKFVIPLKPVDGMNLIWHSDLVVSGGGTMNREAAALGVPVYSIFRGPPGSVDRYLAQEGRLTILSTLMEIDEIPLIRRERSDAAPFSSNAPLDEIVSHIIRVLGKGDGRSL